MAEATPNVLQRFWDAVSHAGNFQFLWQFATASGVAALATSMMPSGWHPAQYVVTPMAWFFGTWAVAATLTHGTRATLPRIKRWMNPSVVTVECHGGQKASIVLTHHGEPTTYFADGRMLSMNDGSANPAPSPFQCVLSFKGNTPTGTHVRLRDDEWAQIILGELEYRDLVGSWLAARRGGYNSDIRIPDTGALMEIILKADPPPRSGVEVKRYKFKRVQNMHIEVTEELGR